MEPNRYNLNSITYHKKKLTPIEKEKTEKEDKNSDNKPIK